MFKSFVLSLGLILASCSFSPALAQETCTTPVDVTKAYEEAVTVDRSHAEITDPELAMQFKKAVEGLIGPAPFGDVDQIIAYRMNNGTVFVAFFKDGCQPDRGGIFLPEMVFARLLAGA